MVGDIRFFRFTDKNGKIRIVKFSAIDQVVHNPNEHYANGETDSFTLHIGEEVIEINRDTYEYFRKLAGFDNCDD